MKPVSFPIVATQLLPSPLKVLTIGNRFSEDAVENYLFDLADALGKKIIIGNACIGGTSICLHEENSRTNNNAYSYRKIEAGGLFTSTENFTITDGIADEDWDYISVQEVSHDSGRCNVTMEHLPQLLVYIKAQAPRDEIIWHQTWAYQNDSTHEGFLTMSAAKKRCILQSSMPANVLQS